MAMAKGSRSGKKARGRPRKKGPGSSDGVRGSKSIDAILGVTELPMEQEAKSEYAGTEEANPIDEISIQLDDTRTMSNIMDLSEWIEAARNLEQDINMGKLATPPILRSTEKWKQKVEEEVREANRLSRFWTKTLKKKLSIGNLPLLGTLLVLTHPFMCSKDLFEESGKRMFTRLV